jgi:hypothetical protein
MTEVFAFPSMRRISPRVSGFLRNGKARFVRKANGLKHFSRNRDNLSDDFGIMMISKLYRAIELM